MLPALLPDRLRESRERRVPKLTQASVARRLGLTRAAVSFWECGNSEPSAEHLAELTRIYSVSADYLLGVTNDPHMPGKYRAVDLANMFTVPVMTPAAVRAWATRGFPTPAVDLERVQVSAALPDGAAVAMTVNNDAMSPLVAQGAQVVISHAHQPVHDAIVVVDMGGAAPVVRRWVVDGSTTYLTPDNTRYPIQEVRATTHVVGRVVEVIHRSFLL